MPRSVHVLRATKPWLIEVRTQIDYFNAIALRHSDRADSAGAEARAAGRAALPERRAVRLAADRCDVHRRAALRPQGFDRYLLRFEQSGSWLSRSFTRGRRRLQAARLQLRIDRDVRPEPSAEGQRHARQTDPRPHRPRSGDRQDRARQDQVSTRSSRVTF